MAGATVEAFCHAVAATTPELQAELTEQIDYYGELLPHAFFGDVSRYAAACVNGNALEKLRPLLDQIEAGLEGGDPEVDNVIWISFIEDEPATVHIRDIAGPKLKAAIEQMNAWMFRETK